jgi:Fe-S-cluster containining protein
MKMEFTSHFSYVGGGSSSSTNIYEIREGRLWAQTTTGWYLVKTGQFLLVDYKGANHTDIKLDNYYGGGYWTNNKEEIELVAKFTGSHIVSDTVREGHCIQCGSCCLSYHITLEAMDIQKWVQQKRSDILKHLDVSNLCWINLKTHEPARRCPWLRKNHKIGNHTCKIHDTKPAVCQGFPYNLSQLKLVECKGFEWRKYLTEGEN